MNLVVIWNKIRATCTPELNRLLFDLLEAKTLNSPKEEQLLHYTRLVVVRELHKEGHQQNFHLKRQKEGESITHFMARLQTLAKFCKFTVTFPPKTDCHRHIDYSSDMMAEQMMARLNIDHQTKISTEAATLTTIQQKFDGLVSLKMTDCSTSPFWQYHAPHYDSQYAEVRPQEAVPGSYDLTDPTICQALLRMWKIFTSQWIKKPWVLIVR